MSFNKDCLRKTENWSHLSKEHKFDKTAFNPTQVLEDIPKNSPKLDILLKNIKKLDEEDLKTQGKQFKHFIFSEVKFGVGVKVIASAMIASGYKLGYDRNMVLLSDAELLKTKGNNFLLLSSTPIYNNDLTVKNKKAILSKYNERDTNIYGDLARFILLDAGFKEGIDLFDVKYVHIFESQTSNADLKQAIGRATRMCGQKGLEFHPKYGWILETFIYNIELPKDLKEKYDIDTLHDLYLKSSGIDLTKFVFTSDLEKYTIIGAVDYELTKNVHKFVTEDERYNTSWLFEKGVKTKRMTLKGGDSKEVNCHGKCSLRPTRDVPIGLPLFICVLIVYNKPFPKFTKTNKVRSYLCDLLKNDRDFCTLAKKAREDPVAFVKRYATQILGAFSKNLEYKFTPSNRYNLKQFVFSILPRPEYLKDVSVTKSPIYTPKDMNTSSSKSSQKPMISLGESPTQPKVDSWKPPIPLGESPTKPKIDSWKPPIPLGESPTKPKVDSWKPPIAIGESPTEPKVDSWKPPIAIGESPIAPKVDSWKSQALLGESPTNPKIDSWKSQSLLGESPIAPKVDSLKSQSLLGESPTKSNILKSPILPVKTPIVKTSPVETPKTISPTVSSNKSKTPTPSKRKTHKSAKPSIIKTSPDQTTTPKTIRKTRKSVKPSVIKTPTPVIPSPVKTNSATRSPTKSIIPVGEEYKITEKDIVIKPLSKKLTFLEMKKYILDNFSQFTWPKVKMENKCIPKGGSEIVEFTPTQDFISHFFTPQSAYKGMLLYQTVGTGKTCCAIATATRTFEKEGYTILWVTRASLKSDIFKNMFDWVCNINIQERMRKGLKIPTDPNERMRLLSKAWRIRPISYKQFSNLVTGKNEYYTELVNINGKDDPLRKTLLIIDEAHKLYGGEDLSGNERPDMEKFKESLMHSYSHSKENSVKVLLMTATPITNDPMELIKLVNLCKEKNEQIPDEIDEFYKKFEVTSRGNFSNKGSLQYLNAITGNISYLSREADGRQFVKPVVTIVKVPMSTSGVSKSGLDDMKNEMNHRIRIEKDKLEELQDNYNDFKKEISQHKKTLTADCKGKPKAECLSYVKVAMERLEKELFSKKQDVVSQEENIKIITKNLKDDYRLINEKTKDDSSQQGILENKCLKKR